MIFKNVIEEERLPGCVPTDSLMSDISWSVATILGSRNPNTRPTPHNSVESEFFALESEFSYTFRESLGHPAPLIYLPAAAEAGNFIHGSMRLLSGRLGR